MKTYAFTVGHKHSKHSVNMPHTNRHTHTHTHTASGCTAVQKKIGKRSGERSGVVNVGEGAEEKQAALFRL